MKTGRKIELLAPAKNLETGIAAIDHGADAVYIGAPAFSARASAGNSIDDIKTLADYAHLFHAWVYVALNTILKDEELEEAERMAWDIYRAGADAIIVQDLGILEMSLPPIALHASTQMNNRTVEKVGFLEKAGFSQVVLARELTLDDIQGIANATHVPLEVFVHGALCTSYSGQCYISQALTGRSANRGECAQFCRLPYSLQDKDGRILATNKHLLSLKDLNLSSHLEELLDAGVYSLKIEGRLKDLSYVKNITAYYRQKLDEIFARRPEYQKASSGTSTCFFHPQPTKSFNRDFTSYFLYGRNKDMASPDTPKSIGEPIGNVKDINGNYFTIQGHILINNGDGLCFINQKKELEGFRVNRAEGNRIYPMEMPRLEKGIVLYRNHDQDFERQLSKKTAEREINIKLSLEENNFGFTLSASDEDGYQVSITMEHTKELAQKPQGENIKNQLGKLGNTPFVLSELNNRLTENWFIPSSLLSEMRRQVVESLIRTRKIASSFYQKSRIGKEYPELPDRLTYLANVNNQRARDFYQKCGVRKIDPSFELEAPSDVPVMTTKYCLRYQLGMCAKGKAEPLMLTTGKHKLEIRFDCINCEMQVIR